MESDLHLALKEAAAEHLSGGIHCWYESELLFVNLRVDVHFTRLHREYFIECETRPSLKRLLDKGRRRNEYPRRNVYILVAPGERLRDFNAMELRGFFDLVYFYDEESDSLSLIHDLRCMGWLRDAVLDRLLPFYHDYLEAPVGSVRHLYCGIRNIVMIIIQCSLCKLGLPSPWHYCPRDGCPDSHLPYLDNILWFDDDE